MRLLKTHYFTQILDCEKSTEKNWVSDQTWGQQGWARGGGGHAIDKGHRGAQRGGGGRPYDNQVRSITHYFIMFALKQLRAKDLEFGGFCFIWSFSALFWTLFWQINSTEVGGFWVFLRFWLSFFKILVEFLWFCLSFLKHLFHCYLIPENNAGFNSKRACLKYDLLKNSAWGTFSDRKCNF